jgi:hypothetical protein
VLPSSVLYIIKWQMLIGFTGKWQLRSLLTGESMEKGVTDRIRVATAPSLAASMAP